MPNTLHIAICTAQVPFTYGGNEALVDGLREALAARGRNVADRLRRFNGLEGTPLYPPIRQGLALEAGPYGDYVFALSRLDAAKRLDLLLEALALAPGVRAVIAGTGPDAEALRKRAARL